MEHRWANLQDEVQGHRVENMCVFVAVTMVSHYYTGVSPPERDKLHKILLTSKDFVDSAIFEDAKEHAVDQLESAWIRHLKEDMKAYIE